MRLAIWAWNPSRDNAPPLEIILELDKHESLPICNKDHEENLQYKLLPLTRARHFLKIITSFAGVIEPFSSHDLSLYYTLTRKRLRVTLISSRFGRATEIHRDLLFIDLPITFAKEIRKKSWTLFQRIFKESEDFDISYDSQLRNNARVLISFVGPTSQHLAKVLYCETQTFMGHLEVTLGSTTTQFNPSSNSSLTIYDTTLYPIPGRGYHVITSMQIAPCTN